MLQSITSAVRLSDGKTYTSRNSFERVLHCIPGQCMTARLLSCNVIVGVTAIRMGRSWVTLAGFYRDQDRFRNCIMHLGAYGIQYCLEIVSCIQNCKLKACT